MQVYPNNTHVLGHTFDVHYIMDVERNVVFILTAHMSFYEFYLIILIFFYFLCIFISYYMKRSYIWNVIFDQIFDLPNQFLAFCLHFPHILQRFRLVSINVHISKRIIANILLYHTPFLSLHATARSG